MGTSIRGSAAAYGPAIVRPPRGMRPRTRVRSCRCAAARSDTGASASNRPRPGAVAAAYNASGPPRGARPGRRTGCDSSGQCLDARGGAAPRSRRERRPSVGPPAAGPSAPPVPSWPPDDPAPPGRPLSRRYAAVVLRPPKPPSPPHQRSGRPKRPERAGPPPGLSSRRRRSLGSRGGTVSTARGWRTWRDRSAAPPPVVGRTWSRHAWVPPLGKMGAMTQGRLRGQNNEPEQPDQTAPDTGHGRGGRPDAGRSAPCRPTTPRARIRPAWSSSGQVSGSAAHDQQLLEEVKAAPLDDASRHRCGGIHRVRSWSEGGARPRAA